MNEWENLTLDEKKDTIKSLIKNLQFYRFNVQMELDAEMQLTNPKQSIIDNAAQVLNDIDIKEQYYNAQLDTLNSIG